MKTHYKIEGTPNSPVLVFSNSLGTDLRMWDAIVPPLLPYFRVIRYDTRGLGQSPVTSEPYSMAQLGQDVLDLLDELGLEKVHFCGLSMGGQIGQWLAIHHGHRLHKLVLSNTAAKIGKKENWNARIEWVEKDGMQSIWDATQKVWFRQDFLLHNPHIIADLEEMFLKNEVSGYLNCCAAVRDADFSNDLYKIQAETLVIAGNEDPATTVADAEFMVEKIPNAVLEVLPARHIPCIEQPAAFANALIDFLVGKTTFEKGMHVRRTALGDAHVNRANQNSNAFTADFQNFISRYAWGEIWTRPGLSKHNRSLITLAMMIALQRKEEFKMHVKAALHNGVSIDEIKEVILQSGIYCGLPAANDAYHSAMEVLTDLNIDLS
jgi:3-oxoadipate enol-lactonase/4-carboxymuconolactone decarboxylase